MEDYDNKNNETYRYYVSSNRGTLTVINEENLGMHKLLEVKKIRVSKYSYFLCLWLTDGKLKLQIANTEYKLYFTNRL